MCTCRSVYNKTEDGKQESEGGNKRTVIMKLGEEEEWNILS